MTAISVSYAELQRTGIAALRALGFSFSSGERGAQSLAAVEAATGQALLFLRNRHAGIRATDRRAATIADLGEGCSTIDAGGQSLLEMAPLALDVTTADARRLGKSALLVTGTFGMPFVADFVARSAGQWLDLVGVYNESNAQAGWFSLPCAGNATGGGTESLQAALDILAISRGSNGAMPLFDMMRRAAGGAILLVAIDRRRPAAEAILHNELGKLDGAGGEVWQEAAHWLPRIAGAIREGILVDKETFRFFTSLVAKTWMPTSERSRSQQG